METKLTEETEKNAISTHKNGFQAFWSLIMKMRRYKEISQLEIIVFFLYAVLLLIMFGAGISTMIQEAANFFPINPVFMYPLGFFLMGIVVMATHVVSKLSAELCFNWQRYNLPYKIMLPITNIALILVCWSRAKVARF